MHFNRLIIKLMVVIGLSLLAPSLFAANPLPQAKAFPFSVSIKPSNELLLEWHIAPGYYLYRDRMQITAIPASAMTKEVLPQGTLKRDLKETFFIYQGTLRIPLQLKTHRPFQLQVAYQGCAEKGFCYPPVHQRISYNGGELTVQSLTTLHSTSPFISSDIKTTQPTLATLLTDQNKVRALLDSQYLSVALLIFVGLGLLLAFTPCVLPMIPILAGIIVGQEKSMSAARAFLLSLTYVMGSSITYALAGVGAAYLGNSLQVWLQQPWIIAIVSGLFLVLALSLFDVYHFQLPQKFVSGLSRRQKSGTYAGAFFMGVLSALIVSPCVTAPLVGVLMYIGQTGNLLFGASALFAMGIGMGLPLLIIGSSAGKWLPKSGPWMDAIKKCFGLLMIAMAIWLSSRILSPLLITLLWGGFLFGVAVFFGFYLPRVIKWRLVSHSVGIGIGISALFFIGGVNTNHLLPWHHEQPAATSSFKVVHSLQDFNREVLIAQAAHQPIVLDFYADWCDSCVAMDRNVFNLPTVQHSLHPFVLLRADLSANTPADEILLKHFGVVAPPTVLFFNNQGLEVSTHRIVGEVDASEFLMRINTFITANCDKKIKC